MDRAKAGDKVAEAERMGAVAKTEEEKKVAQMALRRAMEQVMEVGGTIGGSPSTTPPMKMYGVFEPQPMKIVLGSSYLDLRRRLPPEPNTFRAISNSASDSISVLLKWLSGKGATYFQQTQVASLIYSIAKRMADMRVTAFRFSVGKDSPTYLMRYTAYGRGTLSLQFGTNFPYNIAEVTEVYLPAGLKSSANEREAVFLTLLYFMARLELAKLDCCGASFLDQYRYLGCIPCRKRLYMV